MASQVWAAPQWPIVAADEVLGLARGPAWAIRRSWCKIAGVLSDHDADLDPRPPGFCTPQSAISGGPFAGQLDGAQAGDRPAKPRGTAGRIFARPVRACGYAVLLASTASCGLQSGCANRVAEQLGLSLSDGESVDGAQLSEENADSQSAEAERKAAAARARAQRLAAALFGLGDQLRTGDLLVWRPSLDRIWASERSEDDRRHAHRRRRGIAATKALHERVEGPQDFYGLAALLVDFPAGAQLPDRDLPAEGVEATTGTGEDRAESESVMRAERIRVVGLVDGEVSTRAFESWAASIDPQQLSVYRSVVPDHGRHPEFAERFAEYAQRWQGRPRDALLAWNDAAFYDAELVWKLWQLSAGEDLGQATPWLIEDAAPDALQALDAERRAELGEAGAMGPVITAAEVLTSGSWQLISTLDPAGLADPA